jgi:hypothetical protein
MLLLKCSRIWSIGYKIEAEVHPPAIPAAALVAKLLLNILFKNA